MPDPNSGGTRRRRADAERSRSAVLAAAAQMLGKRPEAGLDDVAQAAGVSRQTVYAHFSSRERLVDAVLDHVTDAVVAAMDAAAAEETSAEATLFLLLDASRRVAERQPMLLRDLPIAPERAYDLHRPIVDRLTDVVERGRRGGEFTDRLPVAWLVTAIIALAHAAAEESGSGRMTDPAAEDALRASLRRLLRPDP